MLDGQESPCLEYQALEILVLACCFGGAVVLAISRRSVVSTLVNLPKALDNLKTKQIPTVKLWYIY